MLYTLTHQELLDFFRRLVEQDKFRVIAPLEKGPGLFCFTEFRQQKLGRLRLDYPVATLSPIKKYLLPEGEVIYRYRVMEDGSVRFFSPLVRYRRTILFAVHPYDIKTVKLLDLRYGPDNELPDPAYCERKGNAVIIGLDLMQAPPHSFCGSVGAHTVEEGFDLMLTKLPGRDVYTVQVGTEYGRTLLAAHATYREATEEEVVLREEARRMVAENYPERLPITPEDLPTFLRTKGNHPTYAKLAEACVRCGACTSVCPTCMCYDTEDKIALVGACARCERRWDSCLFANFTTVAGGHVFRGNLPAQLKHRTDDKFLHLMEKYGLCGCVGCGRCATVCKAGVANPLSILHALMSE